MEIYGRAWWRLAGPWAFTRYSLAYEPQEQAAARSGCHQRTMPSISSVIDPTNSAPAQANTKGISRFVGSFIDRDQFPGLNANSRPQAKTIVATSIIIQAAVNMIRRTADLFDFE